MRKRFERLTGLMVGTYRSPSTWHGEPAPWFVVGPTWWTEGDVHRRNGVCVVVGRRGFYVARGAA